MPPPFPTVAQRRALTDNIRNLSAAGGKIECPSWRPSTSSLPSLSPSPVDSRIVRRGHDRPDVSLDVSNTATLSSSVHVVHWTSLSSQTKIHSPYKSNPIHPRSNRVVSRQASQNYNLRTLPYPSPPPAPSWRTLYTFIYHHHISIIVAKMFSPVWFILLALVLAGDLLLGFQSVSSVPVHVKTFQKHDTDSLQHLVQRLADEVSGNGNGNGQEGSLNNYNHTVLNNITSGTVGAGKIDLSPRLPSVLPLSSFSLSPGGRRTASGFEVASAAAILNHLPLYSSRLLPTFARLHNRPSPTNLIRSLTLLRKQPARRHLPFSHPEPS